jgi:phosphoserine phosphatase
MSIITPTIALATTRVILVRHGRSTFNEQGRYQGSSDEAVLTEAGVLSARQVGQWLQNQEIDAIYSSPLQRVQQTLKEILAYLPTTTPALGKSTKQIKQDDRLREIDLPAWEGLSFKEVRENRAEDYRCWKQKPHAFQMLNPANIAMGDIDQPQQKTGMFPVVDLYKRAQAFWQEILPQHVGQTILIVCHGGTNHALISTALGIGPESHHRLQQSNCGISELQFPGGELYRARLHQLNLTTHLGEQLPKLKEGKTGLRLLLIPIEPSPEDALKTLSPLLKGVEINYALIQDPQELYPDLEWFLGQYQHTTQVRVHNCALAQVWQDSIALCRNAPSALITGLVLAYQADLLAFIDSALVSSSTRNILKPYYEPTRLTLKPFTMSVLHYPSAEHPPILQALNYQ